MLTYQKSSRVVIVTPTAPVAAGDFFSVGGLTGVAPKAIAANAPGEMIRRGQFGGKKPSALVINAGDQLYYAVGAKELNKTSAGNVPAGTAPIGYPAGSTDVSTVL